MSNELFVLLSRDANIANAFAAIFSAVTAFAALIVSSITVYMQRNHNKVSIRPIAEVTVADYENSLRVKLRNNGIGPMFVKSFRVKKGSEQYGTVIECMPLLDNGRAWTHFSNELDNRTIQPDGVIILLELTAATDDIETDFPQHRDRIRRELKDLEIFVDYTDMYGTKFKKYSKTLEWFGRKVDSGDVERDLG